MSLTDKISKDTIVAMKSGDKVTLGVLRMLKSEFKYKQIDSGRDLTDEDYLAVLNSAAKKRRDAIDSFEKGGRDDLVAKETAELEIVNKYLPQQLSDDELEKIVAEVFAETDASSPADIGLIMKNLMPRVKGKADGRKVNEIVTSKLKA
ncbi:MAG: GatB/YqeY domain-containing protein [candidate division Zixibacteria bacterium]|nr:GatB/YqeY domain-containing protein [candidate division Zixibacteria bacterium]